MVNHTKSVLGTTAEFLGIELDSNLMQARLPKDKLLRARNTVSSLLTKTTVPHRVLESAVGFLPFASKVVIPGRAFLRQLFDAIRRPVAIIRITSAMRADLRWWKSFLETWDGLQLLRLVSSRRTIYLWTDALGKFGMGGYLLDHPDQLPLVTKVFSTRMATRHRQMHINFKEMKAVLHAITLWLEQLRGTRLTLYCDNEACVYGLQKSSIKGAAMVPLQDIAMIVAQHDIYLEPTWIPTKANQLADELSRVQYKKIADRYPQLRHLVTTPPH